MNVLHVLIVVIFSCVSYVTVSELLEFQRIYMKKREQLNRKSEVILFENNEEFISIFSKSLQFETTDNIKNFEPFEGLLKFMEESFPTFFESSETFDEFNNNAILHKISGTGGKSALLLSHIDVVPSIPSNWKIPPYSGRIEKGYIYGRGALDNKVTAIAILQAFENLLKKGFRPKNDWYISFGFDEESRSDGAIAVSKYLQQKTISPSFILDEGGCVYRNNFKSVPHDVALISLNEKPGALLNFTIHCQETGHVSFSSSDGCVDLIASIVLDVKKMRFPSHSQDPVILNFVESVMPFSNSKIEFFVFAVFRKIRFILDFFFSTSKIMDSLIRTTQRSSLLKVGEIYNILPDKGYFAVDTRRFVGEPLQYVIDEIKKVMMREGITKIDCDVVWTKENEETAATDVFQYEVLKNVVLDSFENIIIAPFFLPGGTDLQYYKPLSNFTYNFSPIIIDNDLDDLSRTHGNNERISTDNYIQAVKFYQRLITRMDEKI